MHQFVTDLWYYIAPIIMVGAIAVIACGIVWFIRLFTGENNA